MMGRSAGLAWVVASAVVAAAPSAEAFVHVVQPGQTLAQIATQLYGDASKAAILAEANGLTTVQALLPPGSVLIVPAPQWVRVEARDSWESLAARYLGDDRRGPQLAAWNGVGRARRPPEPGAVIRIPFVLRHVVGREESWETIAARLVGDRHQERLLTAFNRPASRRPAEGEVVLVPLIDLQLSATGREAEARERARQPDARATENQQQAASQLRTIESLFRDGRYAELIAQTSRLLGLADLTGNQIVTLQKMLAFGYVALGEDALALGAFGEALRRQPDLDLNPITTSPKILRVFRQAQAQATRH